jgi:hypothetical protein
MLCKKVARGIECILLKQLLFGDFGNLLFFVVEILAPNQNMSRVSFLAVFNSASCFLINFSAHKDCCGSAESESV